MDKLMKMLMNKGDEGSEMSEQDVMAKMEVLKELIQMAEEAAGHGIGEGLKKVTVASPSSEGLEEGLEKAQEMLPKVEDMSEEMGEEEMMDENESSEEDEMKKKLMMMKK